MKNSFYTPQFWLLCTSSFLFFAGFNMIIPELPGYLDEMGGGAYKGLIISLFTVTAGISRPFSGKLADQIGRIPIMIIGVGVSTACGLLYPFTQSIALFLMLRLLHGFSTGFKPTGTSAYVADIVPSNRRGEAIGFLGVFGSTGMALGPSLGGWVSLEYGYDVLFVSSSGFSALSIVILLGLKETLPETRPFRLGMLLLKKDEIIEPRAWLPSLVMMMSIFSFGMLLTVSPDHSEHLGIENKGLFFSVVTATSLSTRFFGGKASDRLGRRVVSIAATLLLTAGMALITQVNNIFLFFTAAALLGLSLGLNNPNLFAWTVDVSDPAKRGKAMATVYLALEIGVGAGALWSGTIFQNTIPNLMLAYGLGSVLAAGACLILIFHKPKVKKAEEIARADS
jgi:MFS family permease